MKMRLGLIVFMEWLTLYGAQKIEKPALQDSLRMTVLIDKQEALFEQSWAVSAALGSILQDKISPVVTSVSLLHAFFEKKAQIDQTKVNALKKYSFDPSQWDIYYKSLNSFCLLIPHSYSLATQTYLLKGLDSIELAVKPLKVDESELIKTSGYSELKSQVGQWYEQVVKNDKAIHMPDLKEYFFNKNDILNLLISSDGFHKTVQETISQEMERHVTQEQVFKDLAEATQTDPHSSPLSLEQKQKILTNQAHSTLVDLYASGMPSWNLFVMGHGFKDSNIVGLDLQTFKDFSLFLNNLNISLAMFLSCYIGGSNKSVFMEPLKKEQSYVFDSIKYLCALIGIADTSNKSLLSDGALGKIFDVLETDHHSDRLINALSYATVDRTSFFSESVGHTVYEYNLTQLYMPGIGFVPLTKTKGAKSGALQSKVIEDSVVELGGVLNKKFVVEDQLLKNQLARLSQKEDKSKDDLLKEDSLIRAVQNLHNEFFVDAEKTKVVLLNTPVINIPLTFKDDKSGHYPSIVTMLHQSQKDKHEVEYVHIFDSITVQKSPGAFGLFNFLIESFGSKQSALLTSRRFMIKKIQGKNDIHLLKNLPEQTFSYLMDKMGKQGSDIVLEDVIITNDQIEHLEEDSVLFNGYITFKYQNSYWILMGQCQKNRNRYAPSQLVLFPMVESIWNDSRMSYEDLLQCLKDPHSVYNRLFVNLFIPQLILEKPLLKAIFNGTSKNRTLVESFFDDSSRLLLNSSHRADIDKILDLLEKDEFQGAYEVLKALLRDVETTSMEYVAPEKDLEEVSEPTEDVISRREKLKEEFRSTPEEFEDISQKDREEAIKNADKLIEKQSRMSPTLLDTLRSQWGKSYDSFFSNKK